MTPRDKKPSDTLRRMDSEDYELALDNFGMAKCGVCGMKLPLDAAEIEKHCLACEEAQAEGRHVSDDFARTRTEDKPARNVDFLPAAGIRPLRDRAALLREKLSA